MGDFGVNSMVAPLQRVAVRPPSPVGDFEAAHWAPPVDLDLLAAQHAAFVELLRSLGCDVVVLDPVDGMPDSCFVYGPAFVVPSGVLRLAAHQHRERESEGAAPLPTAAVAALWRPWRRLRMA